MSASLRTLSFPIYEDEDCRTGFTGSFPSLDAGEPGAGQAGLTTHTPPPPLPSPFTVRVPSGGSSSSSSAASSVLGPAGRTAHFPPPFKVRAPSTSSSSSAYSDAAGPAGRVGLHMAPRSTPWGPVGTPVGRSYGDGGPFVVKVPSAGSSSSGYLSTGSSSGHSSSGSSLTSRSSISYDVRVADQPGFTSSATPHRFADDNKVTVTTSSTCSLSTTSSSTGSFHSCLSGHSSSTGSFYSCFSSAPTLIGSGESNTESSSFPLPRQAVPGSNCFTCNFSPSPQQRKPVPARTPHLGRYMGPHEARQSGSLDELDGIKDGAEKQRPRRRQPRLRTPPRDNRARKASRRKAFTFEKLQKTAPLDGVKGPGDGAHEQKQLDTPTETPEYRRFVDVLVKDWMRNSVEQEDVASMVHVDVIDDVVVQQRTTPTSTRPQSEHEREHEQLPTPADTPESRGVRDVSAGALACTFPPEDDAAMVATPEHAGDSMVECLGDLEGLNLADDGLRAAQRLPSPPGGPGSRPHDPPGRLSKCPVGSAATRTPRRGGSRVQKGGRRRRRRTEIELTMHHAIRWSGMGDVVPNVSVVTGKPLVQVPLPCTFGEGPSRKPKEEEGGGDFAAGLSRGLVREIEKQRAERVRKMGIGA